MDMKKLGRFIAELRLGKELTQEQLANRLHVSKQAISGWENGKYFPDITMIEPLADELGVSMQELLEGNKGIESEENSIRSVISMATQKEKILKKRYHILFVIGIVLASLVLVFVLNRNDIVTVYHHNTDEDFKTCAIVTQYDTYSVLEIISYISESAHKSRYADILPNSDIRLREDPANNLDANIYGTLSYIVDSSELINNMMHGPEKVKMIEDISIHSQYLLELKSSGMLSEQEYNERYVKEIHNSSLSEVINMCHVTDDKQHIQIDTLFLDLTLYSETEIISLFFNKQLPVNTSFHYRETEKPFNLHYPKEIISTPSLYSHIKEIIVIDRRGNE